MFTLNFNVTIMNSVPSKPKYLLTYILFDIMLSNVETNQIL